MRILIIGSDGLIGSRLYDRLISGGQAVVGTSRRRNQHHLHLDFSLPLENMQLPEVDVAVFCAAMTGFSDCRAYPQLARRINVDAPVELARRLSKHGSRVLFLSTSAVFNGQQPRCPGTTPTSATSFYGRLKSEAEAEILSLGSKASVLRLTKVLSPSMALFATWISRLSEFKEVVALYDRYIAPISIDDVTDAICAIIQDHTGGIYQISGPQDVSYVDVAEFFAHQLSCPVSKICARSSLQSGIPAEENKRFESLDSSRLEGILKKSFAEPFETLSTVFKERLKIINVR